MINSIPFPDRSPDISYLEPHEIEHIDNISWLTVNHLLALRDWLHKFERGFIRDLDFEEKDESTVFKHAIAHLRTRARDFCRRRIGWGRGVRMRAARNFRI